VIPSFVTILEESSFEGCAKLEPSLIDQETPSTTIDATSFEKRPSLIAIDIPICVSEHSCLFRIDAGNGGAALKFSGFVTVSDGDGYLRLTLDPQSRIQHSLEMKLLN
jgi:hypothetical protein